MEKNKVCFECLSSNINTNPCCFIFLKSLICLNKIRWLWQLLYHKIVWIQWDHAKTFSLQHNASCKFLSADFAVFCHPFSCCYLPAWTSCTSNLCISSWSAVLGPGLQGAIKRGPPSSFLWHDTEDFWNRQKRITLEKESVRNV